MHGTRGRRSRRCPAVAPAECSTLSRSFSESCARGSEQRASRRRAEQRDTIRSPLAGAARAYISSRWVQSGRQARAHPRAWLLERVLPSCVGWVDFLSLRFPLFCVHPGQSIPHPKHAVKPSQVDAYFSLMLDPKGATPPAVAQQGFGSNHIMHVPLGRSQSQRESSTHTKI